MQRSAHCPNITSLRSQFYGCHGLRFLFLNVNSLYSKIHEIEWFVGSARIDVLGLAETKIDDSISDSSISIPGFVLFRRDRSKNGGGVALYVRSTLQPVLECIHSDLEALVVKLPKLKIHFTVTYLPPSCTAATRNSLRKFIGNFSSLRNIVFGDFNIDALSDSATSSAFIGSLATAGFAQLVSEFTRVTDNSSTCIDLIFTNCAGNVTKTGISKMCISDHYGVFGVYSSKDLSLHTAPMQGLPITNLRLLSIAI